VPRHRRLIVVNLRAQPVEIHHGGDVVVVPALGHAELPELSDEGGQLAELARRGAVSVQVEPVQGAAAGRSGTAPARPRSTGARRRSPGRKTPTPKSPEGGT
jgi:hypothetical protein